MDVLITAGQLLTGPAGGRIAGGAVPVRDETIVAAFAGDLGLALAALAARHFLMYGASATMNAFQLSSFTPAERAGASAILALAWAAANAIGAVTSGAVRSALGPAGFIANLLTLAAAYLVAAVLTWTLFRAHEPRGDIGTPPLAVPDSSA